jgi:hypothetical protein
LNVFCKCCTVSYQNEPIQDHAPLYPYGTIIWLKFIMSICLTAVNISTGVLPLQPYQNSYISLNRQNYIYKARGHGALHICEQSEIKQAVERRRQWSFSHGQFISVMLYSPIPESCYTPNFVYKEVLNSHYTTCE